jgi:hypothetical protein
VRELYSRELQKRQPQQQAQSRDAQKIAKLEREVADLRQEMTRLHQENRQLCVKIYGGTIAEAKAVGFRFPDNARGDGKVQGLIGELADALRELRARVGDGMRHRGPYRDDENYTRRCHYASRVSVVS